MDTNRQSLQPSSSGALGDVLVVMNKKLWANKAFSKAKEIDPDKMSPQKGHAPVFIFGNLLFDPKVFNLFEEWNMHVTGSDFCTSAANEGPEINASRSAGTNAP